MDKKISLRKTITYSVIMLALLAVVCIWPLKLIRYSYTAKSDEIMVRESDPISVEYNMAQMFDGIGGELKSVDLYVCNDMSGQIMTFRLYDENHEQVYEQFYNVEYDFVAPAFVHIPVRFDIEDGKEYSFIVEGLTTDLYLAYEDRNTTTSPVNYFMAYGGAEVPEYDLIVRYNYSCPFKIWMIAVSLAVLALLCGLTYKLTERLVERKIVLRKYLQIVINPILVVGAIAVAYVIPFKRIFGPDTKNNLFVMLGIWLLLGVIFVYINIGLPVRTEKISIRRILRTIAIATALWYCYEYMNGLYNIFHYYSVSKLVIVFLVILLTTFSKKELLNIPNAIWLVAGPILGYLYYRPQREVELYNELYRLNAWVIALGGFLVINIVYTIIRAVRKEIRPAKINIKFGIPFAVFAIGICILANGRPQIYLLVGLCVLMMYRLLIGEETDSFSKDLCAGIILTFYMMVWYSLRHRPYYYYVYYRYNMGFHTVTVTAYYVSMVLCAAWMRLYSAFRQHCDIRKIIPKMFTFGLAASYLIFTMSRTGFLSSGVTVLVAVIFAFAVYHKQKERLRQAAVFVGVMLLAVVYMFPVTFSLTDIMPRLFNDPVVFEYEVRDFSFSKGMPLADSDYMTIEQFVSEFGKKVFGIDPDEKIAGVDMLSNLFDITVPVYAAESAEDAPTADEDVTDMSNGRFDIFKSYIAVWNMWGHEDMEAELPSGELAIHAHNSFLQVAHDHGIVFGIYFILFIVYVIILYLIKAVKYREDDYNMFPLVMLACFCLASLVEWIMHPCNPLAFSMFMAIVPLIKGDKSGHEESN